MTLVKKLNTTWKKSHRQLTKEDVNMLAVAIGFLALMVGSHLIGYQIGQ